MANKTANIDSDLYGDIYGDDDVELLTKDEQDESTEATTEELAPSSSTSHNTLPNKPQNQSQPNISYSAQIAQQFSAYQQTPSQERQSKSPFLGGASIPTHHEGNGQSQSAPDSVFGKKPSEMHDAGKLFIGGLNWDTTDEGLSTYFSQFGKVDACTIMRDPNGTSRGFAFLTFEDPSAVAAVVAQEHILDGKAIDPKRAIPREEHLRNTRYFVGGLAPATTSESMKAFFSAYGKVVDATVMLDRESGRSKGFGFVTFEDATNTDQLVGKHLIMDDKQIEVKLAQPRSQREQAARANAGAVQQETRPTGQTTLQNMPLLGQNPMSMMFNRRMGMNPGMMSMMNPMAMMGNQFNPMLSMGMMGGMGMNGMGMNGLGAMGMNGMPMGMGNMLGAMGAGGGAMGMGARTGMRAPMNRQMTTAAATTPNGGVGPARVASRGQHNFHPYAR